MKIYIILSYLILTVTQNNAQSIKALNDSFPIPPKNFTKPHNWKEADKNRNHYYRDYPSSMNLSEALTIITTDKDFGKFLQAKKWCIDNYIKAIPDLLDLLTDTTKVGLENSADLIIWDRIKTKELEFYGHGGIISEDIFTIAGRCSHILHALTGEKFATVYMGIKKEYLLVYQEIWLNWFWEL
jgi:hypothetical protein